MISRIGKCYHLFAPQNTTWHCFYPINPKSLAKIYIGIGNKVLTISSSKSVRPSSRESSQRILLEKRWPVMQSEKRFSTQLYSSGIPISIYNGTPIVEETIRLGTAPTTTTTLKNNWFYKQNYSPARISHFLLHLFHVHRTTSIWNLLMRPGHEQRPRIFLSLFEAG